MNTVAWNWLEPNRKTWWLTYAPQVNSILRSAKVDSILADAPGGRLGRYLGASLTLDMVHQT